MAERVTVSDMMDAREARAQAQRALLARYPGASVVCLCMNIAGAIKRTENIERAFSWGLRNVKAVLAPCETLFDAAIHEKTGPEAMLCVRADARAIKRRLCALEDGEALGRLLALAGTAAFWQAVAFSSLRILGGFLLACALAAVLQLRSLLNGKAFPRWARLLKYMAACCLTLTILVVTLVLAPVYLGADGYRQLLLEEPALSLHLLCPLLTLASFLLFELSLIHI